MLKDKIIEIFVKVDDFCIEINQQLAHYQLGSKKGKTRNRKASLCDSEIMTLLIAFHFGHFTNFKHFYLEYAKIQLADCLSCPKTVKLYTDKTSRRKTTKRDT